jgi:hypothetical protein
MPRQKSAVSHQAHHSYPVFHTRSSSSVTSDLASAANKNILVEAEMVGEKIFERLSTRLFSRF